MRKYLFFKVLATRQQADLDCTIIFYHTIFLVLKVAGDKGQCLTCGKILSNVYNALRHYELNHVTVDPHDAMTPRSECSVCGKGFVRDQALKDHLRKVHRIYQKYP